VLGEGEPLWPEVLRDFENGGLKPCYAPSPPGQFDLADAPLPRFDLLDPDKYNRLTVQTSRGCPHQCEFCASARRVLARFEYGDQLELRQHHLRHALPPGPHCPE